MDESKFNLWRATFAFCFIDGVLSAEESRFIEEKLRTLPLTKDQKAVLQYDLKSPPAIDQLLPLITRAADRGFLINNIRLLSRVDNLSPSEKAKIEELSKIVMGKIDMKEVAVGLQHADTTFSDRRGMTQEILNKLSKF